MKKTFFGIFVVLISFVSSALGANFTGMWWDPSKEGTGVFMEHLDTDNCVCGAWYFYDESGNPIWTTFFGGISAGRLTSNLYSFTGPSFGATWDASQIHSKAVGTVTFDFLSDSSITMSYQVFGASGKLNLTLFSMDVCPGWLWWDPERPGQGVAFFPMGELGENEQIAVVWYVYDTTGNPVWYTALGPAREGNALDAYHYTGPPAGQAWDTSKLIRTTVGSINMGNMQAAMMTGGELLMPKNTMTYHIQGISDTLNLEPFWCSPLCK